MSYNSVHIICIREEYLMSYNCVQIICIREEYINAIYLCTHYLYERGILNVI